MERKIENMLGDRVAIKGGKGALIKGVIAQWPSANDSNAIANGSDSDAIAIKTVIAAMVVVIVGGTLVLIQHYRDKLRKNM